MTTRETTEMWNVMTWEKRFWAAWQAFVELETKHEKALIQIARLKLALANARLEYTVIRHKVSDPSRAAARRLTV